LCSDHWQARQGTIVAKIAAASVGESSKIKERGRDKIEGERTSKVN